MEIERHDELTAPLLTEILGLLVDAGGAEPLGEAKHAQLEIGASDWSGVLIREEGTPVGYAHVRWGEAGGEPRATAELVTASDRDDAPDLARLLADEVRALVARRGGGPLYMWAHRVAEPADALPAAAGLSVQRRLAVMSRPLVERPTVPAPPKGVHLRPYRPGEDDDEFLRVNNASFADHPEQGGWDHATLEERRRRTWFDPEGFILAWRGERLLGFHWTKLHRGRVPVGEVYVLGVAPDAQGLGLGRVLLDAGLAHLHDRGCREAILYVDGANTSAVGLYNAAGFATLHLEVCFEETVPAAA